MLILLTACGNLNINQNEVTNEENIITTVSDKQIVEEPVYIMLNALIEKNENVVKNTMNYIEGEDGYLYSVDFSSYKIIDEYDVSLWNNQFRNYVVELDVSKSNDERFKIGKSKWNVGICFVEFSDSCEVNCVYFLPESEKLENIYGAISENKVATLSYNFSYSFDCFEDVNSMKNLPQNYSNQEFTDKIQTFMYRIPEVPENNIYSYNFADKVIKKYFDIDTYEWDKSVEYFGIDLWKRWDMTNVYAIINEQTEEYIDMTYFADYSYLTPAKKMRYYFKQNGDNIQLTSVELLKDYGYEPNWEAN